jgi:hypothetical protein
MNTFERISDAYLRTMELWLNWASKAGILTIEYLQVLSNKEDFLDEDLPGVNDSAGRPILEFRKKLKSYIAEEAFQTGQLELLNDSIKAMIQSRLDIAIEVQNVVKDMENIDANISLQFEPFWRIVKVIAAAEQLVIESGLEKVFNRDLLNAFSDRELKNDNYFEIETNVAKLIIACSSSARANNNMLTVNIYNLVKNTFKYWPWTDEVPNP